MFTRRVPFSLFVALGLLAGNACDDTAPTLPPVQVVAADTLLGVPNATVTIERGQGNQTSSENTDASGMAPAFTQIGNTRLTPGEYNVRISADGYQPVTQSVHASRSSSPTAITIQLTRNAPALVFHTFSVSPALGQSATVTIVSQDGSQTLVGTTIITVDATYAAVTFPNLPPSTTYNYTVSASGFQTMGGSTTTPSATASVLYTEVDVPLSPPTVNVEFDTSAQSPVAAGLLVAAQATVTVTSATPATPVSPSVVTQPPSSPGTADIGTLQLQANTTYTYSADFGRSGTATGSFTTPSSTPASGSYVVSITINPFLLDQSGGTSSKLLP